MKKVKVFAPASIGNVAIGFDFLGLALEQPGDELTITEGDKPGIVIQEIIGDNGKLSKDVLKNTASFAAHRLLQHLGQSEVPVKLTLHKKMAMGTGLGSSAASAVAGVYGMNEYLGSPLSKKELLPFAVEAEQMADGAFHADNVAPSLLGGLVFVRPEKSLNHICLPMPWDLSIVMVFPHMQILTSESRAVLKKEIDLKSFITQGCNIMQCTSALYTGDLEQFRDGFKDLIIEPQRAHLIPDFYDIRDIAEKNECIGYSISGAGPSLFALFDQEESAKNYLSQVESYFESNQKKADCFISKVNNQGAKRID